MTRIHQTISNRLNAPLQKQHPQEHISCDESALQSSESGLIDQEQKNVLEIPDATAIQHTGPRTLFIYTHESQPGGPSPSLFECPELFAPYSNIQNLLPVSTQHHTNTHFIICTRLTQNLLDTRDADPLKIQSDLKHIQKLGYTRIYVCWPKTRIPEVLAALAPTIQTVYCPPRKKSISDLLKQLIQFSLQKIRL